MKKILAIFFYFVLSGGTAWAHILLPIPQAVKFLLKEYAHSVNEFGNLLIDCEKIDVPTLENLRKIKESIATHWNKRGIIISIPISEGGLGSSIEDLEITAISLTYMLVIQLVPFLFIVTTL